MSTSQYERADQKLKDVIEELDSVLEALETKGEYGICEWLGSIVNDLEEVWHAIH